MAHGLFGNFSLASSPTLLSPLSLDFLFSWFYFTLLSLLLPLSSFYSFTTTGKCLCGEGGEGGGTPTTYISPKQVHPGFLFSSILSDPPSPTHPYQLLRTISTNYITKCTTLAPLQPSPATSSPLPPLFLFETHLSYLGKPPTSTSKNHEQPFCPSGFG